MNPQTPRTEASTASKRHNLLAATLFALVATTSGASHATLFDRGGGLLYDDVLNITWLQDANYAKTSGYDFDGIMHWWGANTWASNLVYGGYDDWRLPVSTPVGGRWRGDSNWNYDYSYDGTTDLAYNITSPHSELSYMFYVNLGLKGYFSPAGALQPDFGVFGDGTQLGQADVGLVKNLQSDAYWSGTPQEGSRDFGALYFYFSWGRQDGFNPNQPNYAWAVRDGDVTLAAPVPEPETYAMLLAGLGLLGLMAKRRRRRVGVE